MIEIGQNFLTGLAGAKKALRSQKQTSQVRSAQTLQQVQDAQQEYAEKMNYLFRSSAEKTQLAYERARAQLAALQAARAARGVLSNTPEEQTSASLQQTLQEVRTQQQLQSQAAQQTRTFAQKWQELLAQVAKYRKQTKKRNLGLGSVGQAFVNLFK